jgi:hypothetical protein
MWGTATLNNVRCSSRAIFGSSLRSHFGAPAAELGRYRAGNPAKGLETQGGVLERGAAVLRRAGVAVRWPVIEGDGLGALERPRRPLEIATESPGFALGGCAGPAIAPPHAAVGPPSRGFDTGPRDPRR